MDIVYFFNDVTGHHLLGWKTAIASVVLIQAAVQVLLAGRFWRSRGLPISAAAAARIHRWNGRTLLVLSLLIGYACLLVQAGPTSPTRILLHSVAGGLLFVLLAGKLTAIHLSDRVGPLPMWGFALFADYVIIWLLSAYDFATSSTADPGPSNALQTWAILAGVVAAVIGIAAISLFARPAPRAASTVAG